MALTRAGILIEMKSLNKLSAIFFYRFAVIKRLVATSRSRKMQRFPSNPIDAFLLKEYDMTLYSDIGRAKIGQYF